MDGSLQHASTQLRRVESEAGQLSKELDKRVHEQLQASEQVGREGGRFGRPNTWDMRGSSQRRVLGHHTLPPVPSPLLSDCAGWLLLVVC